MKKLFATFLLAATTAFAQGPVEYLKLTDQHEQQQSLQTVTDILNNAADLDLSSPSDNQVLTYDSATGKTTYETPAAGGLSEVSADTSPQLGGDLDTNGNDLTDASDGEVDIRSAALDYTNRVWNGIWLISGGNERFIGAPNTTGTFNTAMAALTDGDTIIVGEGTYYETGDIGATEEGVKIIGMGGRPEFNDSTTTPGS
jgi:hypothetical protein